MLLRRVTVTGFKSFANKTVIDLEPGITAVVGPNGSGKSNLADAIRWALGEQGKNRLRLEGRDELVFAGNDHRARASFAEVTLLFDNEDGAFALDLTEVEISRRMYRSGETDYRLAGRSVRLADLQALLAQAGVGAGTYAVIGQGMIDTMLTSSPAERKLLFDEAAGIRGPELGREAALRKLTATAANLTRLRDIAAELAPRLGSLQTAVDAASEREQLAGRVADLRAAVVAAGRAQWAAAHAAAASRLADLAAAAHRLRHQHHALSHAAARRRQAEVAAARRREQLQAEVAALERARDEAATELTTAGAAMAIAERDAGAATELTVRLKTSIADLRAATNRLAATHTALASNAESAARAAKAATRANRAVTAAQAALITIREDTGDGARDQYLEHALQILKTLAQGLGTPQFTAEQIRLLIHKAGRLLSHATRTGAAELLADLKVSQKQLEAAMTARDTAIEHQTNLSIAGRSLEIDLAHQQTEVERLNARREELELELDPLERSARALAKLTVAEHRATTALAAATAQLESGRAELARLSSGSAVTLAVADQLGRLERTRAELTALAAEQARLRDDREAAAARLAELNQLAADWAVPAAPTTAAVSPPFDSFATLSDQLARAETLLEARTQVYQDHLAEYHEVTARQSDLTTQIADLEQAEADLRKLVAELETLIKSRFKDNFDALAEQFSHYFTRLFEGGSASLELTQSDDAGYGITIKASPKGKRLATIAALSGGERALAGVALVAAILRVNPSPFVVLDEIDAALDEANSGRLATILAELEQYSQLIVITHNRQTMKAAKVLFGVTMGDHHISSLISMRLEQATQLAAR
ncbi:MAG TPA: AAA family ATPase [Candidatus Saccharimonadia bacterium]|nr:AAA family ATPase [Candidatus Saccharimonadia bacterium]